MRACHSRMLGLAILYVSSHTQGPSILNTILEATLKCAIMLTVLIMTISHYFECLLPRFRNTIMKEKIVIVIEMN
jgi:hypothetical protein